MPKTQVRGRRPLLPISSRGGASRMSSNTIRTARARTSGEYGGIGLVMAPSFQDQEPPENPVRFKAFFESMPRDLIDRPGQHEHIAFDFLGYTFQPGGAGLAELLRAVLSLAVRSGAPSRE